MFGEYLGTLLVGDRMAKFNQFVGLCLALFLFGLHCSTKLWHVSPEVLEWTAYFIVTVLASLTIINFVNLVFWLEWAIRMRSRNQRRNWVMKKWMNAEGLSDAELALMQCFAEGFSMGQLFYFYMIEWHTNAVAARAIGTALFRQWLTERRVNVVPSVI